MVKFIQINLFFMWSIMFLIISLSYYKFIHPINLMIFMIIFNLLIYFNLSIWKLNFIYSIMLFLIMISGLLMIFMYFSSLISNEQMKTIFNLKFISLILINQLMMFLFLFNKNLFFFIQFYQSNFDSNNIINLNLNKFINIILIYSYPFNNFTLMNMFFILIAFLTIIKINSSSYSFSLRKIN
uniref:NADH dehydrogenase subunit 6 n=1 Tax=Cryptopone sauteri TaxID=255801 RepID=A0A411HSJ6_9HYME|nr:NADH dehydrogenase subunit 6 [Cryptopone sauteri]QBB73603.1 NADH dehydrogenase subunit 6 [Cryptopone sauteri]